MTGTYLKNSGHSTLNSHQYLYDDASRRTRQTRTAGDYVDYSYDRTGQLKTGIGKESGGATRLLEKLGYAYDAAGNLQHRTNDALVQAFNVDTLNQLTTATNNGTLTVAGTTTSAATNVTVNSLVAERYADNTFAKAGFTVANGTNTFTAVAWDNHGRVDTNVVSAYLPATNIFLYDQNGNLRTNGTRIFEYDDENQLTRITEPSAWKSEFTSDSKASAGSKRERLEQWNVAATC